MNVSKFISVKVVLLAPPVFSPKHLIGLDNGLAIKTHSLYRPLFIDTGSDLFTGTLLSI